MTDISINSTYGMAIIQDLQVVYADDCYAKIYSYNSAKELLNNVNSLLDLVPTRFHKLTQQNCADTTAGKMQPHGRTLINVNRQNIEFTVFSIDHLIDWQGKPALQITIIDLSTVIEKNKQVRKEDLMFKNLITDSGQGILIHRDFKPLMVNQAWVDAMRAESIEQVMEIDSILQFIPPEKHDTARVHYRNIMKGTITNKSSVAENICFDGSKRFFNIYDNPIEWEGEPAMQVMLEDFTDKVKLEKLIAYRASHDQLTDLLNRNSIYDWLEGHFKNNEDLFCILLDIDNFKKVNDTYGHQVGDQVLKSLSNIIKKSAQNQNGVAGRWGGEEFIVFIPNTSLSKAKAIAESIRVAFNDINHQPSKSALFVSVSIGITSHYASEAMISVDELITSADKYLYRAKANGKNCVMSNESTVLVSS